MFFRIGTKSGKNKMYGLKWESPKNVGTKSDFSSKKKKFKILVNKITIHAITRCRFRLVIHESEY